MQVIKLHRKTNAPTRRLVLPGFDFTGSTVRIGGDVTWTPESGATAAARPSGTKIANTKSDVWMTVDSNTAGDNADWIVSGSIL